MENLLSCKSHSDITVYRWIKLNCILISKMLFKRQILTPRLSLEIMFLIMTLHTLLVHIFRESWDCQSH
jgi:hypothetical protein